jgi:plastocyanin
VASAASLIAILAVSGCSGASTNGGAGTGASSRTVTVVENNFAFNPANPSVKAGDTVTFSNQDAVAHHVVVGTTDLGVQQPGKTVSWKAVGNGVVPVKCIIHPSMTGQITVGAGGASSPPASGASSAPAAPAGGSGY